MLEGRVQPVSDKLPRATSAVKGAVPLEGTSSDGADVDRAVVGSLASLLRHKHDPAPRLW